MQICIDSSLLGTQKHFVIDEGFRWSDSIPRGFWHLTGKTKNSPTSRCLDTLMALVGREIPQIPKKHLTAMSQLVTGSSGPIMWQYALPADDFQNYFKSIVQDASSIFPQLPVSYYDEAWVAGSRVLESLKPAKIDASAWQHLSTDTTQNLQSIESFRPGKTGYAKVPIYNRLGTRTGRLTVESGPQILTLKKSNRKLLKSSFSDGIICSLDFRALEARIVLSEAGKSSDAEDMYADMALNLFSGKVERDAVKTAVISELYGISRNSLAARLQVPDAVLDNFISVVREHFGTLSLKYRLKEQLKIKGCILNRYGRPLRLEEGHDNLLINTYAQSTGVDVAMLGFDSIIRHLGSEGIRPLYVLHDAIILDVSSERIKDVEQCTAVDVPTYGHKFLLKFEQIC